MGSVFKEIDRALVLTDDEVRLNALRQVNKFIKSGKWERREGSAKQVLSVLGMKQSKACEYLGITESNYKVMMKRASDYIKEIIGENTIDDILHGDAEHLKSAITNFNINTNSYLPSTYIPEVILNNIQRGYDREYNYDDLQSEIDFFKKYCTESILEEMRKLDKDKLGYIIALLGNTQKTNVLLRSKLFSDIVISTHTVRTEE